MIVIEYNKPTQEDTVDYSSLLDHSPHGTNKNAGEVTFVAITNYGQV